MTTSKDSVTILDQITFQPKLATLLRRIRLKEGSPYIADAERMLNDATDIARPKAVVRLVYIDDKQEDKVIIDGVTLKSKILRVNMDQAQRAIVYVATCGTEVDAWAHGIDDMLFSYWADIIKELVLADAIQAMRAHIKACYTMGKTAQMNPGSLADWPIREQRPFFSILGDVEAAIGVHLTESYLMEPNKSVSGIIFPTETDYANCQLCPREDCPNRKAPFDRDLYQRKYNN